MPLPHAVSMLSALALTLFAGSAPGAPASAAMNYRGPCDASAAVALDADHFVVAGDEVHVVDYKRARGPGLEPYAFQLELYVLAARALFPSATRVRAGVAFLGGDPETPLWLPDVDRAVSERRVRDAASGLSEARATGRFPRAPRAVCDAIHCGFVGRCYPKPREPADE